MQPPDGVRPVGDDHIPPLAFRTTMRQSVAPIEEASMTENEGDNGVKPDVWYTLANDEFVEVAE